MTTTKRVKSPREERSIDELIEDYRPAWSLERAFYTRPDIYQREIERIFLHHWILAGHVSQIPNVGDFMRFDLADESAIIVRGSNGNVHALINVCRHRGSRVCTEAQGSVSRFTCPYHAWTYDIDGRLIAASEMRKGFTKDGLDLRRANVAVLGGMIFISFADEPPSLEGATRDLAEPFRVFGFANLKVAHQETYAIVANWKLAVENYQECYHCVPAHPEYAARHTLTLHRKRREELQERMRRNLHVCGLPDLEIDLQHTYAKAGEECYAYSRTALYESFKSGGRTGQPLAPLLGELIDYDGGASDFTVGPVSYFLAYSDYVVAYVFTPVSLQQCNCKVYWLVRSDAEEGSDYQLNELTWLWHVTTVADQRIIGNNQTGVNSRYYVPGPFSTREDVAERFVDWVVLKLRDVAHTHHS